MTQDYELRFREGTLHALRGETAQAIDAFEACRHLRPDAVDPVIPLLECHVRAGDLSRADALAEELQRVWPDNQGALLAVARLREEEGRPVEALAILRGGPVGLGPKGNAYPDYIRLLLEAGHWDEAAAEARAALGGQSVWRPDALLAGALAQLHRGDRARAREILTGFDPTEYADLVAFWKDRLGRSGTLAHVQQLLADASAAEPENARLAELRDRFTTD